jgi:PTH1 family peptidyl-tRNA hydrolase
MYVIVGLGNPGKRYENTKHNIGFIALDLLAEKHGIKINSIKHKALVGEGRIADQKVILVKPQTYMNLSGNSVREVAAYYKVDLGNLIVVYDDVDLPMGRLRIRERGSAGTHNGMRSIIYDLQEDGFPRVRIGIGGEIRGRLADYVIGGFGKGERHRMEESISRAVNALECIITDGIGRAMNEFNGNPDEEEPGKDRRKKDNNQNE